MTMKDIDEPTLETAQYRRQMSVLGGILLLAIISIIPLLGVKKYWLRVLTYVFMWVGLAGSWNTIYGYFGRVDFGHIVYFGFGAYVTAILILQYPVSWSLCVFLSGILALALAVAVGFPTLRLHGAYFAIATWAFAEAIKYLFLVLEITGGSYGLSYGQMSPFGSETLRYCYYLMFLSAIAMTATNFFIERSKFGYALKAIKGSETAASTSGINVSRYRLLAFAISAFFPGVIGGIYGISILYVVPTDAFEGLKTDQMVLMTLLGGSGHYLGPVIGAVSLTLILEFLWANVQFAEVFYLVILGALIVAIVIFLPKGVIGLYKEGVTKEEIVARLKAKFKGRRR